VPKKIKIELSNKKLLLSDALLLIQVIVNYKKTLEYFLDAFEV